MSCQTGTDGGAPADGDRQQRGSGKQGKRDHQRSVRVAAEKRGEEQGEQEEEADGSRQLLPLTGVGHRDAESDDHRGRQSEQRHEVDGKRDDETPRDLHPAKGVHEIGGHREPTQHHQRPQEYLGEGHAHQAHRLARDELLGRDRSGHDLYGAVLLFVGDRPHEVAGRAHEGEGDEEAEGEGEDEIDKAAAFHLPTSVGRADNEVAGAAEGPVGDLRLEPADQVGLEKRVEAVLQPGGGRAVPIEELGFPGSRVVGGDHVETAYLPSFQVGSRGLDAGQRSKPWVCSGGGEDSALIHITHGGRVASAAIARKDAHGHHGDDQHGQTEGGEQEAAPADVLQVLPAGDETELTHCPSPCTPPPPVSPGRPRRSPP